MKNRRETTTKRQQAITDYLHGSSSYKELGIKYGVPARTVQTWVRKYRKQEGIDTEAGTIVSASGVEKLKLQNAVLEEALKIAREQTGIDFLKKTGAR